MRERRHNNTNEIPKEDNVSSVATKAGLDNKQRFLLSCIEPVKCGIDIYVVDHQDKDCLMSSWQMKFVTLILS